MVHVPLDLAAFNRWARAGGLIRRGTFDAGFALHVLLGAMFSPGALQPFRLFAPEHQRFGSLYAYTRVDADTLRGTAQAVAIPECLATLDLTDLRSKAMPEAFRPGQRLGFDIRIRPVRRLRRNIHDPRSGEVVSRGAEWDAFRVAALHRPARGWKTTACGEPHERRSIRAQRGTIYCEWLAERLGDAATLAPGHCHLAAFEQSRIVRGDGPGPEGPDATLRGTLAVGGPERFDRLVRDGIGRHKAYGYGMVLLRPPETPDLER